jgi:hypothetical protein
VCIGWLEVGSICSDIIIAKLRSATTAGSSSCILLEACPVCSCLLLEVGPVCVDIRIAAAPLSAAAAGSCWILPGTSSLSFDE